MSPISGRHINVSFRQGFGGLKGYFLYEGGVEINPKGLIGIAGKI
jgi:hypothetical protein